MLNLTFLPPKFSRFFLPLALLLSLIFLSGGLYLWREGLTVFVEKPTKEPAGSVSGFTSPQTDLKDIPLYPEAVILSRSETKERQQLTLETTATLSRVYGFYEERLANEWQKEGEEKVANGIRLEYSRKNHMLEIELTANLPEKKTLIMLYLTP